MVGDKMEPLLAQLAVFLLVVLLLPSGLFKLGRAEEGGDVLQLFFR
jgi:hypothetical protein